VPAVSLSLAASFPSESATSRIDRILSAVDPIAGLSGKVLTGGRLNLRRAMDTDADDLPDWWELGVTNSLGAMGATSHSDADNASDLWEYAAGTDALDADSFFRIDTVSAGPGGGVVVQWPSASGRTYNLLRTTNLLVAPVPLAGPLPATPSLNVYTDATAAAEASVFYFPRIDEY
jgi:hypothetical protein